MDHETKEEVQLTGQQMEILKLMADGSTNEFVANHLGISVNTVKYHKKRVFKQLGAASAAQAIAIAMSKKLI